MQPLVIKNVTKSFGSLNILKNINLSVGAGEFLILVGPSGCGKSTLLSIIAGLENPTAGEIHIGDRNVTDIPPKDRDIAMVFQSYALYPNMSVRKNISFGLEIRKTPKNEISQTIDRVAKLLQMEHLLDRKPSQLSGGQRQRVAMGRALARNPSLFLFDEPLSNLDAKLRVDMRAEIKKLHKSMGTTIAYVTHDQIEAMTLGDRIAVMNEGVIQQFGSPQEVYDEPDTLFVAGFLGSPSMNFIPATISTDGKRLSLR
ncbi:MAG: ATP-binding cassette domain-containing protein [Gammaproteobacteria bacterium]|nr:ATP-binding cassette domain-containing protein [Gammaproteobacteria bacterium]